MAIYFFKEKELGSGSFGKVLLVENAETCQIYAAKEFSPSKYSKELISLLENEILISTSFLNPNIIKMIDITEICGKTYIIFEYCNGGDLKSYMDKYINNYGSNFNEKEIQHILRQIINGLSCLHRNKIIHHDIKLENILLNFKSGNNILESEVKISDFGLSKFKDQNNIKKIGGTPLYMDPKQFEVEESIEKEYVDIWSLGILTYYLLTGKHPFYKEGFGLAELVSTINKGIYILKNSTSKQLVSFLNSCLQNDPSKRLTIDELAYHEFISRDFEYFESIQINTLPEEYIGNDGSIIMNSKDNKKISVFLKM